MKDIVLIGAGGLGREAAYLIERINRVKHQYNLLGFVVEEQYYKPDEVVNGYPVLGNLEWAVDNREKIVCHCTIGETKPRARIQEEMEEKGCEFESLIDPDIEIHHTVSIGAGTFIQGGCGLSVNISIGKGALLNGGVLIGHDVIVGDYTCVMTRTTISGNVKIGSKVFIGGAAYIIPKITIEDEAVVAAGSVVFKHVKTGSHVLGNPAKKIEL